jgi:uncharacterized repeat protein (TIGR04002 family)
MRGRTSKITAAGLFAAIITVMTAYVCHIPYGMNGGYIHFGDTLIYLSAVFLPGPYAVAAAALGGGIADLLTAPMWAPATIVIKILITLPFTCKSEKILTSRNIIALFIAGAISAAGYYVAEGVMFGSFAISLVSIPGNLIQSGGSAVFFLLLAGAMDKVHVKGLTSRMLQ